MQAEELDPHHKALKINIDRLERFCLSPCFEPGNWFTTILNAYGNPIKHYGDFDVALKIDQAGPIRQFLA